jgi:antitoxin HicB
MNSQQATIQKYMDLPYTVILRKDDEGDVIAAVKELDGCVAHGEDELDALNNLHALKELWIQSCLKRGDRIPEPDAEPDLPSGKWLQRVPRTLHKKLVEAAAFEGVSLNQLVTSYLSAAIGERQQYLNLEASEEAVAIRSAVGQAYFAVLANTASVGSTMVDRTAYGKYLAQLARHVPRGLEEKYAAKEAYTYGQA